MCVRACVNLQPTVMKVDVGGQLNSPGQAVGWGLVCSQFGHALFVS